MLWNYEETSIYLAVIIPVFEIKATRSRKPVDLFGTYPPATGAFVFYITDYLFAAGNNESPVKTGLRFKKSFKTITAVAVAGRAVFFRSDQRKGSRGESPYRGRKGPTSLVSVGEKRLCVYRRLGGGKFFPTLIYYFF